MCIHESETLMMMNLCVKTRGPRLVTKCKLTSRAPVPGQAPGPGPRARAPGPGPRAPGPGPGPVPRSRALGPGATMTNFVTLLGWIPTLMSYAHIYIYIHTYTQMCAFFVV